MCITSKLAKTAHIFNANVDAKWMAKMLVGYARVSTDGQSVADQIAALKAAGAVKVYSEKLNGARSDRPQLAKAMTPEVLRRTLRPDLAEAMRSFFASPRRASRPASSTAGSGRR